MSTNPTYQWAQGVFQLKRMLSTAATLIAVGGLALAGAGSASAHSAMVDGTAQCRPDGTVSVTWTVTNDYQLPVQVTQTSSTGGGSVTGLPVTIGAASSSGNTNATVSQVGITPGTPTATLGVHGVWSDGFSTDSSGTVTLPQDCGPTTTTVTPVAPVLTTSQACDVPGSITIASTEGVSYFFNGAPIAAGKHEGPLSGTVTAKALDGFELKGTSSWPVSVRAADTCSKEVTPVAPTVSQASECDTNGFLTVPSTTGVSYFFNGAPIAAGKHEGPLSGTVTAKALDGFELKGTSSWAVQIAAVVACETGGGETGGTPVKAAPPASPSPTLVGSPAEVSTPTEVSTPAASELAYTGVSPQTWTYGVGGGLALLLLGGVLTVTAARLRS
jgi:hypothetical protein